MNAYELADELDKYKGIATRDAANMLRQQADRIAELEKQSEPVAWVDDVWIKRPDLARNIGIENMFMRSAEGVKNYIPLYTKPQTKPLSDEEIAIMSDQILCYQIYDAKNSGVYEFARAIEAKVRGKK